MAAVQPPGHVVHFTGQVAWDEHETIVGPGDVEAQMRQCFTNIARMLDALGGRMDDIVAITTYYTQPYQLPAIQKVRTEVLSREAAPVSTSVMVAGLGHPEFLVELTPIAVIPEARFIAP
ncbi:MAG: RidA family protein [Pseudomonadota bacterium]